jgi:hypothetical protein
MQTRSISRALRWVALVALPIFSGEVATRAATIQFLTPAGSSTGIAYGVDGLNVVGQDVAQRGFYYNGATNKYTVIQPPGGGTTAAHGISGNKIVGSWGKLSFVFDGVSYTTLSHPLGVNDTTAWDIDGNNIVGQYIDAAKTSHGFLFDGTTYTTIDFPGAIASRAFGISGNVIVGSFTDTNNLGHGFYYDGTTYTKLDDPFLMGTNSANGVDGIRVVGNTINSPFAAAYIFDGTTFNHPFGIELSGSNRHRFYGISGNRIAGEYNDRPFVYIIPEPSALVLATFGTVALLLTFARRRIDRSLSGPKHA